MGNFAENLNLGNRFRPPLLWLGLLFAPSICSNDGVLTFIIHDLFCQSYE